MKAIDPIFELVIATAVATYGDIFLTTAVLTDPQPVSVNDMYTTFRGKRNLTKKGEAYRDALARVVAQSTIDWKKAHGLVYQNGGRATLLVGLYFKDLYNGSWRPGKLTPSGKPSQPHKVQDASNYIKIIEDAVTHGSGIDDCNNLKIMITKDEDKDTPRTQLIYMVTPR